jgi:hypothetical protein
MNPMIVRGDVGSDRDVVLRRSRAHISGADRGGGREAEDYVCGSNMRSHGQNASP